MDGERPPIDSQRLLALADKFHDKRYRDSYVSGHTRQVLARQMRNFRGDLSQGEFGEIIGKRQTVVSRLENPNYGAWQLRTMFEVAKKLDVAVLARFVNLPTFLKHSNDLSDSALHPAPYDSDETDEFARELAFLEGRDQTFVFWGNQEVFPFSNIALQNVTTDPATGSLGLGSASLTVNAAGWQQPIEATLAGTGSIVVGAPQLIGMTFNQPTSAFAQRTISNQYDETSTLRHIIAQRDVEIASLRAQLAARWSGPSGNVTIHAAASYAGTAVVASSDWRLM